MLYDFYKKKKGDQIWWTSEVGKYGRMLFSFDKKTIFNLFSDYPFKLTKEQREIFDKENPYWAKRLGNR